MTESFAGYTRRWLGMAAQVLNWRPKDFWTATPAELAGSLHDPAAAEAAGPSREQINKLMERDGDG